MSEAAKPRPEFRNINIFNDVRTYRMPVAALVSILHRVSGALMFVLLPFIIWLFDKSVSSEISFGQFTSAFTAGLWFFPGWFVKLVVLALIWAYLHHFCAGIRFLLLDLHKGLELEEARKSSKIVLVVSLTLTLIIGVVLW